MGSSESQQQQQQGCAAIASSSHVISIPNVTNGIETASSSHVINIRKVTNEIEADCLEQIENVPRLKLILADWEVKYKESQSRIDRKESLGVNVKNEIYHLIGFFSVFQGVVLTAVSQASALTCHNWWGPFALSLLCSIASLFGICHKFYNFFEWKQQSEKETQNAQVLKHQIRLLKKLGTRFNFSRDAPDRDDQKEKEKRKKPKTCVEFLKSIRYQIFALWVILSMLGFSVIILLSCYRILCHSGRRTS